MEWAADCADAPVAWGVTVPVLGAMAVSVVFSAWLCVVWLIRKPRPRRRIAWWTVATLLVITAAWVAHYSVGRPLFALRSDWSGGYDSQSAHDVALLSLLAYEDRPRAVAVLTEHGYSVGEDAFDYFAWDTHTVLILVVGDQMAIAYRGTDEREDWLTNLDLVTLRTSTGLMHRGFYCAAGPALEHLTPWLQRARSEKLRLWFGGHSLGGALALVTALRVADAGGVEIGGVLTFGQPAVGVGSEYAEAVDRLLRGRYFRHANRIDLVPEVSEVAFQHAGSLVFFDRNGALRFGSPPIGTQFGEAVWRPPGQELRNHEMQGYVGLLRGVRQAGPTGR